MASVVLQSVTRQFGAKLVLDNVSLELRTGQRVGLVGPNGAGKTTLFKIITGDEKPDLGTVTRTRGLLVGLLPQEPQLDSDRTLHDEVGRAFDDLLKLEHRMQELAERIASGSASGHDDPDLPLTPGVKGLPQLLAEYDQLHTRFDVAGGHRFQTRLNEILGGLGFTPADHHLPIRTLSGGQKCRAALAKLLLLDRELLLLDEPTNHLDLQATQWLEKFLAGHHGGAVIVSHDRYLLDRVADKIIEVQDRRVSVYPGNYSNYAAAKQRRQLTLERQHEQDQAFIAKEQAYIAEHLAGQRSRQAKGRRTRLERRTAAGEFVDRPRAEQRRVALKFESAGRARPVVLRCDGLSKSYGEKVLFRDLTLEVFHGSRLGIVGPNGCGKTTLLRVLLEQVKPDAGQVELFEKNSIGYYDQEHSGLDRSRRLIDEIIAARPELSEQQARSVLGRFLFSGDDVFKPIGKLSGGEQSRVRLARLVLTAPQVLVLDEPTNHLDIASREALEEALADHDGSIIVVSHDRYFLDRVVDRLLVLAGDGTCILHAGNYSDYLRQAERAAEATAAQRRPLSRPARPAKRSAAPRTSPYDSLTLEQIEEQLIAAEEELAGLHQQFSDDSLYRTPTALRGLRERVGEASAKVAALNQAWSERVESTNR